LHAAAWSASEDLAKRRQPVDPNVLMERGKEELRRARSAVDGTEPNSPVTSPGEAA
jgi:hypothetical protein